MFSETNASLKFFQSDFLIFSIIFVEVVPYRHHSYLKLFIEAALILSTP
jgi:hypothetical protein